VFIHLIVQSIYIYIEKANIRTCFFDAAILPCFEARRFLDTQVISAADFYYTFTSMIAAPGDQAPLTLEPSPQPQRPRTALQPNFFPPPTSPTASSSATKTTTTVTAATSPGAFSLSQPPPPPSPSFSSILQLARSVNSGSEQGYVFFLVDKCHFVPL
jgi:hypothetical protein